MLTKGEEKNLLDKLLNIDYNKTKGKFFDTFYIYSITYERSFGDIYILGCDDSFEEILKEINFSKKEYDYLYEIEYNKEACISYTNIIHTSDHLWKPIESIINSIQIIQKKTL